MFSNNNTKKTSENNFELIVKEYYDDVYRFAYSLAGTPADASDLTQQTFLRYANKSNQIKDENKVKSWLFTVLRNEFTDGKRKATRHPHPPSSNRHRKIIPLILSVAALLLLTGTAVNYFLFPPAVEFPIVSRASTEDFRDHMAYFATQRFTLDKKSSDLEVSRQWLHERGSPIYKMTPELLVKLKGKGCREIDWNGTKVSLVCFLNGNKDLVHLFVVETANLSLEQLEKIGINTRHHNLETRGWNDNKHLYLLVASDPKISLDNLM